MYAITGITGKVGGAVAQSLLEMKLPVRAVLRDAAKAKAWAQRGCEIALADVTDVAALTKAFSGTEGVFVLIPPMFDPTPAFTEARGVFAAIKSALQGSLPERIVCLSAIGAQASQPNLLNQLGLMEQTLGTLSIPTSFVRAAWFMENYALDVSSARDEGLIYSFLQPLDKAIPMVATADIGPVVAGLLQESWKGTRTIELEGPQQVSPIKAAAAFSKILERPVRAQAVPRSQWEAIFRSHGMKNPIPRAQMLDGFNQGWLAFEGGKNEHRIGSRSIDDVLADLLGKA
jgi:uncharacterized protein YbjT (DUF2867 family)